MSFGSLFRQPAPQAPAGVRVRPGALPSPRRTGDGPGVWIVHAGRSRSSVLAHGQGQGLPGSPAIHPVTLRRSTTPDDPLRLAVSGASGAAPTQMTMKASSIQTDFEAARRFVSCCLRFTTRVATRHARLAFGWRAAPLPGGGRTRWIATRGFRSSHPPLQGFAWRNMGSSAGWDASAGIRPEAHRVETFELSKNPLFTNPSQLFSGFPGRFPHHQARLRSGKRFSGLT